MTDDPCRGIADRRRGSRRSALALFGVVAAALLAACSRRPAPSQGGNRPATTPGSSPSSSVSTSGAATSSSPAQPTKHMPGAPIRFVLRPDDNHVPYAGTAGDGRKFFLSEELFDPGGDAFVGLFLWKADGTFDRVRLDPLPRPSGLPPGQAGPAVGGDDLVQRRLRELGRYRLEPISVQPFLTTVRGVDVGWLYDVSEGLPALTVQPGDFICYYPPWDGVEYDT